MNAGMEEEKQTSVASAIQRRSRMEAQLVIEAEPRARLGKGGARALRREGKVPVVVYGGDQRETLALAVHERDLMKVLRSARGLNTIFQLQLHDDTVPVIIKDWQADPIKGMLLHADLMRIDMAKVTRVRIPVELVGEPIGVKAQGGLLDFATHYLEVECLPADIPESIRVDVSGLEIGDHVSVKDLNVGEKLRILDDPERVIVSVLAPRVEEVPAVTPAEEAVAPPTATPPPEEAKPTEGGQE
ncbi:MAG: 50S ribosomal protein L25 [Acidobacteria bacterium]|nr:MAG: 50S ribosomal protein L25 [Acidobacteriota bacterium]